MAHRRFRDVLGWGSWCRYAAWRLTGRRGPLRCRLATGERLIVRPPPSSDLDTANEVFASDAYAPPLRLGNVRRVVDLGSNVGYTLLYWARLFPDARITGFEPHPTHRRLIRDHLRMNALEGRVELVEAAAGTSPGTAVLSDAESGSSVMAAGVKGFTVPVVDVFDTLPAGPIGLLKIDIEGSEYPILSDPRFGAVRAEAVILEWHRLAGRESGPEWCEARLREAGYEVTRGWEFQEFGLMWGLQSPGAASTHPTTIL